MTAQIILPIATVIGVSVTETKHVLFDVDFSVRPFVSPSICIVGYECTVNVPRGDNVRGGVAMLVSFPHLQTCLVLRPRRSSTCTQ